MRTQTEEKRWTIDFDEEFDPSKLNDLEGKLNSFIKECGEKGGKLKVSPKGKGISISCVMPTVLEE